MKTDIRPADFWPLIITVVQLQSLEMNRLWAVWDACFDKRPTPLPKRAWLEHRLAHAIQDRKSDADKVGAAIDMLEPLNVIALYKECLRLCPDCSPRDLLATIMDIFSDGRYYG
jgi:hypothetical protein